MDNDMKMIMNKYGFISIEDVLEDIEDDLAYCSGEKFLTKSKNELLRIKRLVGKTIKKESLEGLSLEEREKKENYTMDIISKAQRLMSQIDKELDELRGNETQRV